MRQIEWCGPLFFAVAILWLLVVIVNGDVNYVAGMAP